MPPPAGPCYNDSQITASARDKPPGPENATKRGGGTPLCRRTENGGRYGYGKEAGRGSAHQERDPRGGGHGLYGGGRGRGARRRSPCFCAGRGAGGQAARADCQETEIVCLRTHRGDPFALARPYPGGLPVARQCGGCVFRHISYEAELRAKEQRVRDALSRIGGFSGLPVLPILGAAQPDRYPIRPSSPLVPDGRGEASFSAFTLPTATASWRAKTVCCSPRSLPARWRPCAGGRRRRAKQCTTREQGAAFCGICICEKALLPVR